MDTATARNIAEQFGKLAAANARSHLGVSYSPESEPRLQISELQLAEMLSIAFQRGFTEGNHK